MSVILNISYAHSSPPPAGAKTGAQGVQDTALIRANTDTLELSSAGETLAQGVDTSSFRLAQLRAIRTEINNGTYETRERIEGTVRRLLDVIA